MDGCHRVRDLDDSEAFQHLRAARSGGGEQGCIVHHIADVMDSLRNTLAPEIGDRGLGRAQQQGTDMIGQYPIDLLGHPPVEGAQSRLQMGYRDV